MKRRAFVDVLAGMGLAWPLLARSEQTRKPLIGFLNGGSPGPFEHLVAGFRKGLGDTGLVEGRNVVIEYRWADGHYDRLPELAKDLVAREVDVLVATGGENSALAAKAQTSSTPIVFAIGGHPVDAGLVASLSRPGGNLTGLTQFTGPLESKRLGLLQEVVPTAALVAVLVNPSFANAPAQLKDVNEGARRAGVRLALFNASVDGELEPAVAAMASRRCDALVVTSDPFFNTRRRQLVALVARHKIPAIYEFREFALAGGLMSYGANLADGYRQVGAYTGRILNGAKPADLPVLQPTRFEQVVNLKTAKALGITIPQRVLLRADEVIE
jgi:putative ABC transport system substrate-binding protein